ncbi:MAG: tRNA pseudouridine synthase A, partial [Clostridia bacterium]|nr:tRNA pseudouridine synthase A [Clostridia bacterium]
VNGAGRTDAGVHAAAQIASFKLGNYYEPGEIIDYVNRYLPVRISVSEVSEAAPNFHARFSAKAKTYVYRIWNSPVRNVFEHPYLYQYTDCVLDCEKMQEAANLFIGECDLAAFCVPSQLKSYDKKGKSTVRRIYNIEVCCRGDEISLIFKGSGFMYNTVRIITGTLIEVGAGLRSCESVSYAIKSRDRALAGFKAPACGLILASVEY